VHLAGFEVSFSKLTLVVEFLVMAAVLIWRPWGLLGRAQAASRTAGPPEAPLQPISRRARWLVGLLVVLLAAVPLLAASYPYLCVLGVDILIAVLFAASLHFIMGPAGLHSFGHAAYFGLGAYGAAALLKGGSLPMEAALALAPLFAMLGAALFGLFAVRLSGVYLAMLTLAFSQIVWSIVFQWDEVTGGSNGLVGIWPSARFASKELYYLLSLALVCAAVVALRRIVFSPFGYAMRAGRDSPLRAQATGIDVVRVHWIAFVIAGAFCGLAGALFAFAKGTISPDTISVGRSVDALVMVLLGGVQTLAGPLVGAALFTWLSDMIIRATEYWRALLGAVILILVLAFPQGVAGGILAFLGRTAARRS
jgi:branched-chain amino acid transport system permease protein